MRLVVGGRHYLDLKGPVKAYRCLDYFAHFWRQWYRLQFSSFSLIGSQPYHSIEV